MALVCLNFDRGVAHENVKSIIYRNCLMQCVSDTAYVKYELYMQKSNLLVGVSTTIYLVVYTRIAGLC